MSTTTANLGLTLPTPNVDTGWGGTLNTDFTIIDNIFGGNGNGTSVGLNVGSGKIMTLSGTMIIGTGDGTSIATSGTIRGPQLVGTNLQAPITYIDAARGTGNQGNIPLSGAMVLRTFAPTVSGAAAGSPQASLALRSDGYVGFGTETPAEKLHAVSSSASAVLLKTENTLTSALIGVGANGTFRLVQTGAHPIKLDTQNITRITVGADGDIGLGEPPNYGSAGQVLTSAGPGAPPIWSSGSGNGWGYIATLSVGGSPDTYLQSTALAGYKAIQLILTNVRPTAGNSTLQLEFYNGSAWINSGFYGIVKIYGAGGSFSDINLSSNPCNIAAKVGNTVLEGGVTGVITITNFDVSRRAGVLVNLTWGPDTGSGTNWRWGNGGIFGENADAYSGIRIRFSGTTVESGNIIILGVST